MNENLNKLQQTIIKEIDFYNDTDVTETAKEKRVNQSLTISKLISNYVQIENIKLRASQITVTNKDVNRKCRKHA